MKRILIQFGKQYLYWFCFFVFFRVIFLLTQWSQTAALPWTEILGTFRYGLRMDLSFSAYIMVIPGLLLCAAPWFPTFQQKTTRIYTFIFLLLLLLLGLSDLALYPEWNTRIGAQALTYLKTPKGVLQCLTWWQWMLAITLYILLTFCAYRLYLIWIREDTCKKEKRVYVRVANTCFQLFLTACLILPIRGGLDTAPLNLSAAYFSPNLHANYAAYNYAWAFMYSVVHTDKEKCPLDYMTADEATQILAQHRLQQQDEIADFLKPLPMGQQPNVIIILLESYAARAMGCYGATTDLTPCLSRWAKEGILWNNFYANGNRSDKGFSAIFADYPPLVRASSLIEFPEKLKSKKLLPTYFKEHGYGMHYYYGGDVEFYNNKLLLVQAGVDHIVERSDFPMQQQVMQKWGVPDEYLWQRMGDDLLQAKEPYFAATYNISTHPPFDLPQQYTTNENDRYATTLRYSDSCLNVLLQRLKHSPQWDHTLVIITSDHTCPFPEPTPAADAPESFHIPMIWLGGMIAQPAVISNICSQVDLTTTLMQQLHWPAAENRFAKNMFGSDQYAIYIRDEFWGCITPTGAFSLNIDSNMPTNHNGQPTTEQMHFAQAWMQALHDDFQKRGAK